MVLKWVHVIGKCSHELSSISLSLMIIIRLGTDLKIRWNPSWNFKGTLRGWRKGTARSGVCKGVDINLCGHIYLYTHIHVCMCIDIPDSVVHTPFLKPFLLNSSHKTDPLPQFAYESALHELDDKWIYGGRKTIPSFGPSLMIVQVLRFGSIQFSDGITIMRHQRPCMKETYKRDL